MEKYGDHDKSYDEHIGDMQRMNRKLASISKGQYTDYMRWKQEREDKKLQGANIKATIMELWEHCRRSRLQ